MIVYILYWFYTIMLLLTLFLNATGIQDSMFWLYMKSWTTIVFYWKEEQTKHKLNSVFSYDCIYFIIWMCLTVYISSLCFYISIEYISVLRMTCRCNHGFIFDYVLSFDIFVFFCNMWTFKFYRFDIFLFCLCFSVKNDESSDLL